jgi:hypothetical protein
VLPFDKLKVPSNVEGLGIDPEPFGGLTALSFIEGRGLAPSKGSNAPFLRRLFNPGVAKRPQVIYDMYLLRRTERMALR